MNQWGNWNRCDDDDGQVIHVAPTHTSHPLNEVFDRIIWGYFAGLKRLGSGMMMWNAVNNQGDDPWVIMGQFPYVPRSCPSSNRIVSTLWIIIEKASLRAYKGVMIWEFLT